MPHEEIRVALDLSDAVILIEQQQQQIAARDNFIALQGMQLEQIDNILEGEEVSDFALSFPTIDKVGRMMQKRGEIIVRLDKQIADLKAENERMLEALEKLSDWNTGHYDDASDMKELAQKALRGEEEKDDYI